MLVEGGTVRVLFVCVFVCVCVFFVVVVVVVFGGEVAESLRNFADVIDLFV